LDPVAFALLVCATFAAYFPALRGSMLWDDSAHLTRPDLQSLPGLWRIWFDLGATQQYYPLLHSAFWFEHSLWGNSTVGYHLVNVALHAMGACLIVRIAKRLALPGAWLAGVVFALHPLCVEAVAWISEQKSTLSAVFYLAAALLYLNFDESRRRSRYLAALALFVLALLTKTVTATLPASLLVVLWWRRGRVEWKRDVLPLIPWFVLGAAAGLLTAWVEANFIGAHGAEFALTPVQRLLIAGHAFWFYAAKIVWPVHLTFFYPRWDLNPAALWQYLFPATAIAAAVVLWRMARRKRGPLAAFLIFGISLFPALGFFNVYPFRYSFVADHFAYLAIPVAALLVAAWDRPSLAVAGPLAILLGILTFQQAGIYRDEETLYRATLERNPAAWLAHNNLGNLLLPAQRSEAIAHFETALHLKPDFWEAHLSLGNALLPLPGRLADAIAEYRIAASLAPESERVHTNLGNALLQAGRTAEAIGELKTALGIQPGNAEAHNDLGNAFSTMAGRLPDAIDEYQAALRANPEFAEAHNNLGRAFAQAGRMADAIAHFQTALRIRPDYWSAHSNLGNALSAMPGRLPDAIAEYREALRLRPDSATAHNNLGYALSQLPGRLPDAIPEYRQAIALDPGYADAHYNLAAALLQTPEHRAEAVAELETVQRLKPTARVQQILEHLHAAK
jgi:protein O-mannosyl-transferase